MTRYNQTLKKKPLAFTHNVFKSFSNKTFRQNRFSRPKLITFGLIFAVIGGYVVYTIFAAAPGLANVFVSPSGSDSGANCRRFATAQTNPGGVVCASFDKAYHLASPGDTVEVAAGTYGDQSLSADGTKASTASRVVFTPAIGANVIVGSKPLSTKTQTSDGINTSGTTAVTFTDFTVRGDVVAAENSNGVTFQNLVSNNGAIGIYGASNITFTGGSYGNTNRYKSQVYPGGSGGHNANITIKGVTIHDVRSDDLVNFHVEGMLVSDGNGINLSGNTFYNNDVFDLSIGVFGIATLSNITVENNFFATNNNNNSLGLNTNTTSWNGLNVRNNSALVSMRHPECSGGCTNVIYSGNISPIGGTWQCVAAVTYRNNVWTGVGGNCGSSDKSVANPGFVNESTFDLHLTSGSPAINAGDPANCPATDIDGDARPAGAACDAGADEFGGISDSTPPTVSLTAPSNGATVVGSATVSATATDNVAVAGVQFKLDGVNIGAEDTTSPYSISWNSALTTNGSHTLTAVARDSSNNTATSASVSVTVNNALDTTAPTVSITAPAGGSTATGNVTVSANAADNVGVVGVQFKLDGNNIGAEDTTSPYSISWDSTSASNGSHTITAVARDAAANSTTSTGVTVTVSNVVIPPSSTPLAMYNFNENTGTIAADSSGNNNTATLNTATWAAAKNASGLSFNGTSGYASAASSGTLALGNAGTIEGWVKLNAIGAWHGVIDKGNTNNNALHDYGLEVDNTGHVWCILGNGTSSQNVVSAATLTAGVFTHLACSWDGTNFRIIINGVQDQSIGQTVVPASNTNPLYLGQFGGGNDFMNGVLDDVRIYNISLTTAQIAADSATPVGGVQSDTTAPTVSMTAPANGATVSGAAVSVTATAADNVGVAGVQFKMDGNNQGAEDTTSPYSITWNTTTLANGSHTLSAVARDAAGNTTTSSVITVTVNNAPPPPDTTPPTVPGTPTSPSKTTTSISLAWTASTDSGGSGLAGYRIYRSVSGGAYSFLTSTSQLTYTDSALTPGTTYGYKISAYDNAAPPNESAQSAALSVTTNSLPDTTPPTVSMTAPAPAAFLKGNAVAVSATAADNVAVVGVQFKLDGANLGAEDTTSPYSITWNTTTATNASHSLTAVARDAAGNITTSAAVSVTVDNSAPTVSMTAPASGATVSGAAVAVSSTASDNVAVVGVQFKLDGVNLNAEDTTSPYSITWDTTTTTNASHSLTAVARDAAGNTTTSAAVTVTVDNSAPTVSMTAPTGGASLKGNAVAVSATAADNVAVVGVQFKLDGANLNAEDTTSPYSTTWDTTAATAGSHTLTAVARDAAGNTTTSSVVTVTVDNTAPTVSMTAPASGATVSGAAVAVSSTASDNVAVVGVQFKLDGVNLNAEDTTSPYSITWNSTTATNASHSLTAVARDAAGNTTTSAAVTVTVDNSAPTVSMTAPTGGASLKGNAVAVSATAADNVAVVGVQFKLDGANLNAEDTTSPYSTTWDTTAATAGSHTLTAVARDAAGNTTTSSVVTVTVDNTAPTISITAPAVAAFLKGSNTVSANASDNLSLSSVQFKLDGANLGAADTTSPYSVSWDTTTATAGSHSLTAVATDAAGNSTTSSSVTVTVDNTAPTVSMTVPAGGATVSGSTTAVSATAADNVAVVGVQFKLDGVNLNAEDTTSPYSITWDTTTTTNASHSLTAVARDAAGNTTTSAAVTVTVDNSAPTVSVSAPTGGAFLKGNAVAVSATAADNVAVVGVQFKLDGVNLSAEDITAPYSTTWDTTTATNASHTITAVARDAAGNSTTSSVVTVTVDNTAPTVSLTAPAAAAFVKGSTVTLSATASDNTSVSNVQFKLEGVNLGATDTTSPYSTTWNSTTATNGAHSLTAVATDAAGNITTSAAVSVTVDNSAPTLSLTAPAGGASLKGNAVAVSAAAADNVAVVGVQFKLDGSNLGAEDTTSPYSITWDTTTTTNASHSLTAVATDAAGNTTTSSFVTVTVDNIAPTVSMTAPANGATVNGSSVAITATAADNVAVAGVQFKLDGNSQGAEDTTSPYATTWDTTTLGNGSYSLTATVRDAAGNTTTSSVITVTVNNPVPPPPDTTPPTVPTGLRSTSTSTSTISLAWDASTDSGGSGVNGYKLYRGGTYLTTIIGSLAYTDDNLGAGLTPGTAYAYTISAIDFVGNESAQSAAQNISTGSSLPAVTLTASPTIINSGDASSLSWSSTNATTCTASGGWSGTKAISGTESTGSLSAGSTYFLVCSGAGGSVTATATVTVNSVTPPPPPPPPPAAIPGDCNHDSQVNITDLSILLSNYGAHTSTCDFNSDTTVTITDLSIQLSNYGR